jgi:fructokinase
MILCCGEALIDMIPAPTGTGSDGFVPFSGGAVFNTAIALGRLGVPVGMVTGISSDMFGQQLLVDLAASHVDAELVIRSDRPTTLAFVQLVDGQARYAFFDENTAGRMLTPADMPALPPSVSAVFFGGISLAVEPGASAYADLAGRPRGDRVMMLDPNIRPGFIRDPVAYRARINAMIALSDIVKISDEDLGWLYPPTVPMGDRVKALLALGPAMVIVTKGKEGAEGWLSGGGHAEAPGHQVIVADTVGAGDTFNAGVLAKLSDRGVLSRAVLRHLSVGDLSAALAHGSAAAAITVSRRGANPPWAHEITD